MTTAVEKVLEAQEKLEGSAKFAEREYMNIVTVGHVDHGKSTVVGRLLADTGSLPEGKLDAVRAQCARDSKPFEYAFLLDALKNEQSQGITIDTARCFFKTEKRNYIINDAPGHIEFLKNMVTGAARAEAALLVIDAHEGIQENSKRHGYLLSMLGIKQIAVLVNKMDLKDYSEAVFNAIHEEYTAFLARLGVKPLVYIPVAARDGVNIATHASAEMPWYDGPTVLEQIDAFDRNAQIGRTDVFRMPVQDIYKFTGSGDDRRIVAGTIETGSIAVGEEVVFHPSGKRTRISTIEGFNAAERKVVSAGWAAGFQMATQIYIKPGEMMCRAADDLQPKTGTRFRASIFWMGRKPLVREKQYKLKIGAANVGAELVETLSVLDASELSTDKSKKHIDRHDVAEVIIETQRPVAFDLRNDVEQTGRFVIVDDFEIAGAGVILETAEDAPSAFAQRISRREFAWEKGPITSAERAARDKHAGKFVVITGEADGARREIARELERRLFGMGCNTYYLGMGNLFSDLNAEQRGRTMDRDAHLVQLGELARIVVDAGVLFITTIADADDFDLEKLKQLIAPGKLFVANVGANPFGKFGVDVSLEPAAGVEPSVEEIVKTLDRENILLDFSI